MATATARGADAASAAAAAAAASASAPASRRTLSAMASMASLRDQFDARVPADLTLSIVVIGASGDLAKKKTYPALFALFAKG
jgi:glucose-6-phosphate 1-dehydrogenase